MSVPNKCSGCQRQLHKREFLRCMTCKSTYDLECANVSYKLFNIMKKKDQWSCPECMSKKPKTGNINTPIRTSASSGSMEDSAPSPTQDMNITHRRQISKPTHETSFCEQDCSSPETSTQNTKQDDMVTELKQYMNGLICSQVDSLRAAITELTDTIRTQNSRIEKLEARVYELENRSNEHPNITSFEKTIAGLQAEIHDRDQALLLNDVEIAGCPETPNENCTHIVITLAKKIGVDIDEKDVVSAERAGPPRPAAQGGGPTRPRPLAVRLTRRATRDALLRAARVRRNVTTEGLPGASSAHLCYINERLTKHNRQLFQKARERSRACKFKYVWTREGNVFVRQEDGKPRHRLRSEEDLERVFPSI
ncbi:uncharacterized protein LOC114357452 [Ostrinia furnacalis]|uniref:uncharacterized protein LOC114357452 n=1 Tax=Ostrinia furnacalis TaxID=93504 RepID=UPI00103BCAB7|nr:uncharacterized protein LOC114357452 [Ostrinia furnacalis]